MIFTALLTLEVIVMLKLTLTYMYYFLPCSLLVLLHHEELSYWLHFTILLYPSFYIPSRFTLRSGLLGCPWHTNVYGLV